MEEHLTQLRKYNQLKQEMETARRVIQTLFGNEKRENINEMNDAEIHAFLLSEGFTQQEIIAAKNKLGMS